jgi:hypothetical protein
MASVHAFLRHPPPLTFVFRVSHAPEHMGRERIPQSKRQALKQARVIEVRQVSPRPPFGDRLHPGLGRGGEGNREELRTPFKDSLQVCLRGLGHDDEPWGQTSDGNAAVA